MHTCANAILKTDIPPSLIKGTHQSIKSRGRLIGFVTKMLGGFNCFYPKQES